jgi:hypothetical protein
MNGWADRAHDWGKGHPRWTAALSVLLAVIVGLAAFYLQSPHPSSGQPLAARTATPRPTAAPPTATSIPFARPELQAGVAFPRWDTGAYGAQDTDWHQGLITLQQQTGARWVSIVVNLYQDTFQSTSIHAGSGTPSLQALEQGIAYAHSLHLKVFVEPLLTVIEQPQWDGLIYFSSYDQAQAWFDGYWTGYEPYVRAAAAAGADELGIATELQALEREPAALWNSLIARARAAFPGALTYDINWNSLTSNGNLLPIPTWMHNPALDYLGVSEYQPIAESPRSLSTNEIADVWQQQLLPVLDNLSQTTGKQIVLSEIGYRNATDALYRPWDHNTSALADPTLQATAYTAAAQAVFADSHIAGLFFWAWENGAFALSPDARAALRAQYLSPAA